MKDKWVFFLLLLHFFPCKCEIISKWEVPKNILLTWKPTGGSLVPGEPKHYIPDYSLALFVAAKNGETSGPFLWPAWDHSYSCWDQLPRLLTFLGLNLGLLEKSYPSGLLSCAQYPAKWKGMIILSSLFFPTSFRRIGGGNAVCFYFLHPHQPVLFVEGPLRGKRHHS